jgi:hypothetical protein
MNPAPRVPSARVFLVGMVLSLAACVILLTAPAPALALDSLLVSSYAWRDTFLPCGLPSVSLRTNETSILWNPAGIPMGNAYSVGYAYTAVYSGDNKETGTHFVLTNTSGLGFGFTRDNIGEGTRMRMLLAVAPRFSRAISMGWTGKWRGGFNFDVGAMMRIGDRVSLGFVGRDLRDTEDARTYYEAGIGLRVTPQKFGVFFDTVIEDNAYRRATARGGGFYLGFEKSVFFIGSLTYDGEGNTYFKFILQLYSPGGLLEGSYGTSSNDFKSLGGRVSRWSVE